MSLADPAPDSSLLTASTDRYGFFRVHFDFFFAGASVTEPAAAAVAAAPSRSASTARASAIQAAAGSS